jgi:polysaccharide chain length determinant protein (PEP-CTERM system associated)
MLIASLVRRYIAAGWRHRWKALLLAWVICIPGWIAVYSLPSQYQANARIYADAEAILGTLLRGIAVDSQAGSQVDLLQRTLLSRPNLERVIAKTDLDLRVTDLESRERLIQGLSQNIKITPQTRQLFKIDYTDQDPRLAYAVVQTLITLFMESATTSDRQQMASARTFVNQQILSYERQLREAEQRRAEFNARYVDILPSAALGGSSRLEAARGKLTELTGQLQDARARRDLLNQQLQATPATLAEAQAASGGGGGGGNPRAAEAERALRELLLRYTDQHPDVVAQRKIIAELRASGGGGSPAPRAPTAPTTPRGGQANPLHEQLKLRLVDADSNLASLERQVRTEQAEVEKLETLARTAPMVQAESQNMDRDYQVLRKNYEELLARRESLQIAGAARTDADRVRLEVVDPPTVPQIPSGPNRFLFASGVLAAGLGAGIVLVFLLVQLDRGFYTIHDLRGLGLPVLGGVSSATPPKRQVFAGVVFAGGFAMLLLAFGGVLAGGPQLVARMPGLITRLLT